MSLLIYKYLLELKIPSGFEKKYISFIIDRNHNTTKLQYEILKNAAKEEYILYSKKKL
jgi:hypothetical protein